MKRIQALIISLLFLITNNIQASFLQGPNPYSFGPQGRTVSDLRDFAKPKDMVRILPNRPVAATDSSGARVYYTSDGKLALSVSKDGSMSFSLGGVNKSYNSDGELSGVTRTIRGSGLLQEVKDKEGRVIQYKTLNGDGKTYQTFDKDKNLTATYVYKGQGANVDYIQNEMTKGRTYYDDFGREMYVADVDGYILKTFLYSDVEYTADERDGVRKTLKVTKTKSNPTDTGLLTSVREYNHKYNGNIDANKDIDVDLFVYTETFYDLERKPLHIKNADGFVIRDYHYKQDNKGDKILDYHYDTLTGDKTYYDEHGTAVYTTNAEDSMTRQYFEDHTASMIGDFYTEVTKYDIDGKELYTTLKNIEYDEDGTIKKVMDEDDEVWQEYHYTTENGKKVIDYVVNFSDKDFAGEKTYTWYENEKPVYVTDSSDRPLEDGAKNIIRDFCWDGDTLVFTFDRKTEKTQWYDIDKNRVYESMNERIISKNIYSRGQLIGKWNAQKKETTICINERAWVAIKCDNEPTENMLVAFISHSAEINKAIAENNVKVITNLMDTFGWKASAANLNYVDKE